MTTTFVPQSSQFQGFYTSNNGPSHGYRNNFGPLFATSRIGSGISTILASRPWDIKCCKKDLGRYQSYSSPYLNDIGLLNLVSTERNSGLIRESIECSSGLARNLILLEGQANLLATKDLAIEVLKSTCCLGTQAAKNTGDINLEICRSSGALGLQIADGSFKTQLRISESENRIRTEALRNKYELQRDIAECCCSVKEKVDMRAFETNTLIRSIETQGLRDDISRANQENLILVLGSVIG